jgi:hypothetical protein
MQLPVQTPSIITKFVTVVTVFTVQCFSKAASIFTQPIYKFAAFIRQDDTERPAIEQLFHASLLQSKLRPNLMSIDAERYESIRVTDEIRS